MKLSSFTLAAIATAQTTAPQDPYQEIGREVGSIYQRIGSLISASSYDHNEVMSVHGAAETAINSLRQEISTIDWNAMIGSSAAIVYTSQLEDYIKGLATVNEYLTSALTAPQYVATAAATSVLQSIAAETASASSIVTQLKSSFSGSLAASGSQSKSASAGASSTTKGASSSFSKNSSASSTNKKSETSTLNSKNGAAANSIQTALVGAAAAIALI